MRTRLIATVLLILSFCDSVYPILAAEPKWKRLSTQNFELLTTEGDSRSRAALLHFEQVRTFFLKVGIKEPVSATKTLIVAFQSEKEFKPFRPNESAAAYYQRGYDRDYIVMQDLSPDFLIGATHEYVHLLVQHSGQQLPLWLNEGLADFYSTLKPVGKKVKVGEIIPSRFIAFRESKLLDLPTLFAVQHDSPYYNERNRTQIFYAQSWALTHMLIMSELYRPKYGEWMSELVSGKSAEEAFQSVYGQDVAGVAKKLDSYFRAATYNYMLFDTQLDRSAEQPKVELVTDLESGLALASILGASQRSDEARQLLRDLAGKYPTDPRLPASLGYLAMQMQPNSDQSEAREQFLKAIQLNSNDPKLYVEYARMLESQSESSGTYNGNAVPERPTLSMLKKALQLKPTDFETCYELARLLYNQKSYPQAIIALQPLRSLSREQGWQVFRLLAYLYTQVRQTGDAKTTAERLRHLAQTPQEIAEAEGVLEFVSRPDTPILARSAELVASSDVSDELSPPILHRSELLHTEYTEQTAPPEPTESVSGVLQNFECMGAKVRLTVLVNGKKLPLLLVDPDNVHIRGTGTATIYFSCGPQKPIPVTIEYVPAPDPKLGTSGVIKVINFDGQPDL